MTNSVDEIQISMEVLLETLERILSPVEDEKKKAESKIKELQSKVPEEFGIHLAKYVIGNKSSTSGRKLASNIFRQYVDGLWKPGWWCPKIGLETKKTIRELLLSGLCESDSEIRNVAVDAICNIAKFDWPHSWPNLFDTLVEYLQSENKFAVSGSMGVIQLLSIRLRTVAQPTDVGPAILREMYRIFENADIFSVRARSQAVQIFSEIVSPVISGLWRPTDLEEQVLEPSIELFCSKFLEIFREQNGVETETKIKSEIINGIAKLTRCVSKSISLSTFLPAMLPLIWETLIECAKVHREHIINGIEDNGVRLYEEVPAHFQDLLVAILQLIRMLMEYYEPWLKDNIPKAEYLKLRSSWRPEILEHLFALIEITEEQIEQWTDDPKRFINDLSLTMSSYGTLQFDAIRCKAQAALVSILEQEINDCPEIPDRLNATCDLIRKQIAAGNKMRSSTDSGVKRNWWRLHEASIQVFGEIASVFTNQKITRDFKFDVEDFLKNVVLADLNDPEVHPLLLGSCLYVSEWYIEQMPLDLRLEFIKSTINCLKNRPNCTKIRAARFSTCWIRFALNQKNDENENILRAQLPTLIDALFNLGTQLMSVEVLIVVLESFSELASRGEEFTASVKGSICTLAITVFLQYRSDGYIIGLCRTIFSKLTHNPACCGLLQAHLVPILIARLIAEPKEVSSRVFIDLEALKILVEQSPQPLSSILIENAFPALCRFILSSDKHTEYFLDRAFTVLYSYLSVGAQRVIDYRDNDGKTGLQYILQIVDHLLDIATENHQNLSKACEILTKLIATGTMLEKNLEQLLKAMLGYTQLPKSLPGFDRIDERFHTIVHHHEVVRALWVVWARLFETEFDAVLQFLPTAQEPDGQSTLAIVISNVFRNALDSLSLQDGCRTVFRTALCKIVDYGVSHLDSKLHVIVFHETKEGAKKTVPILVKISELVAHELQAIHRTIITRPQNHNYWHVTLINRTE